MSEILVVYATVEGQSRKIAEHVCDHIGRLCRGARIIDAANLPDDFTLDKYQAIIVVASVHMWRHHQAAIHFVRDHAAALQTRPGALVSVSLHAANLNPGDLEEARGYVDEFAAATGWIPEAVHYAAGALRFDRYDFFKRWAMRRIAAERGLAADSATEEIEFTDWTALDTFVNDFLREHTSLRT